MQTLYASYDKTEVEIPSTVKYIYSFAFKNSPDLSKLTIPSSVKTMDLFAFHINDKITDIYSDSDPEFINDWNDRNLFPENIYKQATLHITNRLYLEYGHPNVWAGFSPWCYFENIVVDYNP